MARYGLAGQQYFDNSKVQFLSSGRLYFYEPGTTTDKATYSDEAETIPNTQPVVLDANGRQPDIFFTGQAKIIIQDSTGVQIDVTDPIGTTIADDAFAVWDAAVTYDVGDIVKGSDAAYYKSIVGSNTGNDPTSTPAAWAEIQFLNVWNAAYTYEIGDIAVSGQQQYIALTANINQVPATSPTDWKPLSKDIWWEATPQTSNFNAAVGRGYFMDTSSGTFTATLPAAPADAAMVAFKDYANTFTTNKLIFGRNGNNIMDIPDDLDCDIDNFGGVLQYTTGRGWLV